MKITVKHFLAGLLLLACSVVAFAQEQTASSKPVQPATPATPVTEVTKESDDKAAPVSDNSTADDKDAKSSTPEAAKPQAATECKLCRWVELDTFSFSERYRTMTDTIGIHGFNQLQHRVLIDAKLKFDKEGKYTLNTHVSTGRYFNWAFADTAGGGTPEYFDKLNAHFDLPDHVLGPDNESKGWNLFVRQLYFSAKPVKGFEFQVGSLPILHGENSETTSYDDDGYISGERIIISQPKKLWFDEIAATSAYIGDYFQPNFFHRANHFGQSNYHQFLVAKKLNNRIKFSADYTFQNGVDMMREAVKVNTKGAKVVDWVRFETYQRIGSNWAVDKHVGEPDEVVLTPGGWGYSVHAEKKLFKKLTIGGGFNDIDFEYNVIAFLNQIEFAINGDRMGVGKKFYFTGNYEINPTMSVSFFYGKNIKVPEDENIYNSKHFNVGITFDLLKVMQRTGILK